MKLGIYDLSVELEEIAGHPMLGIEKKEEISELQYKIVGEKQFQGLLECRKLKINGKYYISYLPKLKKSLLELRYSLSREIFGTIVCSMLKCITDVYESGYLSIGRLVLDTSYIYVEQNTMQVSMCYFPINGNEQEESIMLEHLRRFLIDILQNSVLKDDFDGQVCVKCLRDKSPNFYEMIHLVRDIVSIKQGETEERLDVYLESMNPLHKIKILISKNHFVIGKLFEGIDGKSIRIDTISKTHCEIWKQDGELFVKDLNSTNGTFLKQKKLEPGKKYKLEDRDILVVANIPFKVSIGEGKI